MKRQPAGATTWLLVLLAGAVVGLTAYEALRGSSLPLVLWTPAALAVAVLGAWPFVMGWRPFARPDRQLHDCPACGAQWRPADEEGAMTCPACTETA